MKLLKVFLFENEITIKKCDQTKDIITKAVLDIIENNQHIEVSKKN